MALVKISWWQPDWVQKSQVKYGALEQAMIIKRKLPSEWFNNRYVLTQNYCPWSVNLIIESAAGNPRIPLKLRTPRASEVPPLLRWTGSNNGIIGSSAQEYISRIWNLCVTFTLLMCSQVGWLLIKDSVQSIMSIGRNKKHCMRHKF